MILVLSTPVASTAVAAPAVGVDLFSPTAATAAAKSVAAGSHKSDSLVVVIVTVDAARACILVLEGLSKIPEGAV